MSLADLTRFTSTQSSAEVLLRSLDVLWQRTTYERSSRSSALGRTIFEGQAALATDSSLRRWGETRTLSLDDIIRSIDPMLAPHVVETSGPDEESLISIHASVCILAVHVLLYSLRGADARSTRLWTSTIEPSIVGGTTRHFLHISVDSPAPRPDEEALCRDALHAAAELCEANGGWLHTTGAATRTHTMVFAATSSVELPLVLCMDDDVMCRKVLSAMCTRVGAAVISVSGYAEATRAVHGRFFSLVLLDRRLAVRRGVSDIRLAADRRELEQPVRDKCGYVVYVTGEQKPNRCDDHWLLKPAHLEEISDTILQATTHDHSTVGGRALGEIRRLLHDQVGELALAETIALYAKQISCPELEHLTVAILNTDKGGGVLPDDIWRVLSRYS